MPLPARKTHVVSEQDTTKILPLLFFLHSMFFVIHTLTQIELSISTNYMYPVHTCTGPGGQKQKVWRPVTVTATVTLHLVQ